MSCGAVNRRFPLLLRTLCILAGIALLLWTSGHFRIDEVRCWSWPSVQIGVLFSVVFSVGLALLSYGYLSILSLYGGLLGPRPLTAESQTLPRLPGFAGVLLLGTLLHALAMLAPPFLSDDPLAYAAIGRAMHLYQQGMYTPLGVSLPEADPVRMAIEWEPEWLSVGSAYAPGFNWLASLLVRLSGTGVAANLRSFQLLGLGSVVLTAWLSGLSARALFPEVHPSRAAAWAAVLVLLCPLTLIEATMNAHNDGLLMVSLAGFGLCLSKKRPLWAFVWLAAGLLVKASALLLLGLYLLHAVTTRLGLRRPRLSGKGLLLMLSIAALLTALFASTLLPYLWRYLSTLAKLLGNPNDALPYCTHSYECLPRGLLQIVLGLRREGWLLGLCFRCAAGMFLLWMGLSGARGMRFLATAAAFVFGYYLFFHSSLWPWYALSLIPLIPYAAPWQRRAMLTMALCGPWMYLTDLPWNCDHSPLAVGLTQVFEGLVMVVPPTIVLVTDYRRRNRTPSGHTPSGHTPSGHPPLPQESPR